MFLSFFFMDDFTFLHLSRAYSLNDFLEFFLPIKNIPFRPLSQQLWLFTFQKLFGLNPLPYHLFTLILHFFNIYLVYKIIVFINKDKFKAKLLSLVYGLVSLHFTALYSIINANFIQAGFFFFLSAYFWYVFEKTKEKIFYFTSFFSFLLAVFSSEISASLPLFIFLFLSSAKLKTRIKKLTPFLLIAAANITINLLWAGEPPSDTFSLQIKVFPQLFRWYILRGLGLPEGIKNGQTIEQKLIYLLFFLSLIILVLGVWQKRKQIKKQIKFIFKSFLWILAATSIFYFMPNHLSPIYFFLSFLGLLLLWGKLLSKKLLCIYSLIFICLSCLGFKFLLNTHWMPRRAALAKQLSQEVLIQNPKLEKQLTLNFTSQSDLDEAKITFADYKGWQLLYNDFDLKVTYQLTK